MTTQMPKALVLTGYGLNCDLETAHAFTLAGADARRVHINALIRGEANLSDFHILAFIGGFSWGDDHGAGVIQAVRFKTNLGERLLEFIAGGKLIIGICNGFQTLVNLGLLPGIEQDYTTRSVALISNDCGNFRDDWVHLKADTGSPCIFTQGITSLELPVRHGEGKFYAADAVVRQLFANRQAVLQYTLPDASPAEGRFPQNPNGSVADIAGICDSTGRVFGLMPHPEAYNHFTNHPHWTREREQARREGRKPETGTTAGIRIFQNAVRFFA